MNGNGKKEKVSIELLSAISTVQLLKDKIRINNNITGETLGVFSCLWGCASFNGKVIESSTHQPRCAWNYFIKCPHCGYEGNLAKYSLNSDGYLSASACECVIIS